MGLFSKLFGGNHDNDNQSWEEKYAWEGNEEQSCPRCGQPMTKRYSFSDWWCNNCHAGLNDDELDEDDDSESISVYDAAQIWASHGKDEDYTFGFTEQELEDAL